MLSLYLAEVCHENGNGEHGLEREVRLQIMLSPQELKVVDNFQI